MKLSGFLLVLMVLLASGCGPRHQLVTERIAPADNPAALRCLSKCNSALVECEAACGSRNDTCLAQQEAAAREAYPARLEAHSAKMEAYHAELRLYEEKRHQYNSQQADLNDLKDLYRDKCRIATSNRTAYCEKLKTTEHRLRQLVLPRKPRKPASIKLPSLISEYQRSCSNDCSCHDQFDLCFVSCGGRIETRRVCVDNCD